MAKKPAPDPSQPTPPDELSYEQAVEELENLIERIESGETGLDESIRFYERGAQLLKRCRAVLDQAEQRIERLDAQTLTDPATTEPDDE